MYDASVFHYRSDIREVEVDESIVYYDIRYALYALLENFISHLESFQQGRLFLYRFQKLVIRYDNQRIHIFLEEFYSQFSMLTSFSAFESERLCYYTYSKYAHILRCLCDYRSCSCTCPAAHAACNEYHIRTCNELLQILQVFFC